MAAESAIMALLFARLAQHTAHPISWPNAPSFTPPSDHRYLEAKFVPNSIDRIITGPFRQYGLFQVNAHWSKFRGEAEPRGLAEAVAALFPCDDKLTGGGLSVRLTDAPEVRDMIVGDADVMIPIMVRWECRA